MKPYYISKYFPLKKKTKGLKKNKLFLFRRDTEIFGTNDIMVGEISKYAIWVKEGDEFDEDEISLNSFGQNWDETTPPSGNNIVFLKGSCGHFH